MKIVEYRNVSFENVSTQASLDVGQGEFCVLKSHCSHTQSAFLKSIYGMHKFTGGQAEVLGRELLSITSNDLADLRKEIGTVLSIETLPNLMTVNEIYGTILLAQGIDSDAIIGLIQKYSDLLGLNEVMDIPVNKLSQEQKQLICIGAALIKQPKLLLAEHPTIYLSEDTTESVMKLLYDMAMESKMTTIIATHDQQFLRDYPSRVLELSSA